MKTVAWLFLLLSPFQLLAQKKGFPISVTCEDFLQSRKNRNDYVFPLKSNYTSCFYWDTIYSNEEVRAIKFNFVNTTKDTLTVTRISSWRESFLWQGKVPKVVPPNGYFTVETNFRSRRTNQPFVKSLQVFFTQNEIEASTQVKNLGYDWTLSKEDIESRNKAIRKRFAYPKWVDERIVYDSTQKDYYFNFGTDKKQFFFWDTVRMGRNLYRTTFHIKNNTNDTLLVEKVNNPQGRILWHGDRNAKVPPDSFYLVRPKLCDYYPPSPFNRTLEVRYFRKNKREQFRLPTRGFNDIRATKKKRQ